MTADERATILRIADRLAYRSHTGADPASVELAQMADDLRALATPICTFCGEPIVAPAVPLVFDGHDFHSTDGVTSPCLDEAFSPITAYANRRE